MNASVKGSANNSNNGFSTIVNQLRSSPKIPLLLASALAVAVITVLALWARSADYGVLYSNISDRDGGAIVTQLTQMNIPYRFAHNGSALLVPMDKIHETRLRLAQQGLPKGGAVGFELLDQEKFGISQFSEQINYQRALEGELARTIETLGAIVNARVHLALPRPSLFIREQKQPSASVTLNLQPGRALDDAQISAIVYMVSSSVSDLPASNVTVIDQNGHLLTQSDGTGRSLNTTQLKYAAEVETRLQRRIETILQPILGKGNVSAQVTAQIDYAIREQTDEEYRPNPEAIRSKQASENSQIGAQTVGGVPGALSNQPPTAPSGEITRENNRPAKNAQSPQNTEQSAATETGRRNNPSTENHQRDETTNYELDRLLRHTQQKAGNIARLSVAVVVNYTTDADGNSVPLSPQQLEQINTITKEAMGYSQQRGDSLNIVNTLFNITDEPELDLPFWQQPRFFEQMLSIGRYLLVLLAAWLLWLKLLKPMSIHLKTTAQHIEPKVIPSPIEPGGANLDRRAQQRVNAQKQNEQVREMAEQDPQMVAQVIRQWIGTEQ